MRLYYLIIFIICLLFINNIAFSYSYLYSNQKKEFQILIDQKKYEEAIELCKNIIASNPSNSLGYSYLGLTYLRMEQFDEALKNFNKSIEIDNNPADYLNRGSVYAKMKDYPRAITDYNTALELNPDLRVAYLDIGVVYYEFKKYDNAIQALNKVLEVKPEGEIETKMYLQAIRLRRAVYFKKYNNLVEFIACIVAGIIVLLIKKAIKRKRCNPA